ncbi:MAG: hypothetical protein RLZZ76_13 [Candidatus Parcubacteria bacterium]|jgi:hypothetical protein
MIFDTVWKIALLLLVGVLIFLVATTEDRKYGEFLDCIGMHTEAVCAELSGE